MIMIMFLDNGGCHMVLIGPLIASLFITVWELYGIAFRDYLPEVYIGNSAPAQSRKASEKISTENES